ncbi:replication-associated recombination protein A [Fusobacterium sp. MFO224]|uniref:replication-associated recombination protein A n=1 Tax=Fusobacterium sp. MFO224 TaxID=3378070 RepID=UPI003853D3B8
MQNLFQNNYENVKPLSMKLRPKVLDEFIGQKNLIGENKILTNIIKSGNISNMILFGPPGCGKSSLGEIISNEINCNIENVNATTASLNDIREIVVKAKREIELYNKRTVLFLDEIHRFNKIQQDALLSYTETGVLILIGATTENPYHNINNALLSRCLVFEFKALARNEIKEILKRGQEYLGKELPKKIEEIILDISNGDSRIALNYLELYANNSNNENSENIEEIFAKRKASFHKEEDKYNIISAMIKSIRGSDPDAALYWMGRLLYGGEDPRYIARRLVISASEDIGMANPEALLIANAAYASSEKIGMPEIRIILAHAVVYLSISSKSNSCYNGINSVLENIKSGDLQEVPINIKDKNIGYKYPHDYEGNFVYQKYMDGHREYYKPGNNKYENQIREKLDRLWKKR